MKNVIKLIKSKLTGASASNTFMPVFVNNKKKADLKPIEEMLQTADAAATYQTQADMAAYLTSVNAAATYQTQAAMAAYLTAAAAALAYETKDNRKYLKSKISQEGVQFPIFRYQIKNNTGANFAFSYVDVGEYLITASMPIFVEDTTTIILGPERKQIDSFVRIVFVSDTQYRIYTTDGAGVPQNNILGGYTTFYIEIF